MSQPNSKFLFNNSFEKKEGSGKTASNKNGGFVSDKTSLAEKEAPPPAPEEALSVPEETMPLQEVELLRQAAYDEGMAAGRNEAMEQAAQMNEALTRQALDTVAQQLATIEKEYSGKVEELQTVTLDIAMKAIKKLFPTLDKTRGLEEITLVFKECLDRLPQEPRLVVRVADTILDDVQTQLQKIAGQSGFTGRLVFLSEPAMQPGDVLVEWAEGGAERNSAEMLAEIETILNRIIKPIEGPGQTGNNTVPKDTSDTTGAPTNEVAE
ncbi:FliH/SctL family protein [Kiloniella laminariae]|uniref:FliH/SctL family protein n=1 Tax=Kiloniella laminariae TaxID=454162 RepID=A0ABT4LHF0_9PROT|nr:FliH/SctL family protein [Kiloniella laminariae]MCZ4280525.1 FliH/SctL family protein [Kiloniella laminariae]